MSEWLIIGEYEAHGIGKVEMKIKELL